MDIEVNLLVVKHAEAIFQASTPVVHIRGIGGKRWKRNVASGARIGPWLQAEYTILNEAVWRERSACLYLVAGSDGVIRYVGISRNGLKHRWRTSPAYDAETMERLSANQLFHSQCWKHIERESTQKSGQTYEVRCINGASLLAVIQRLGPPLSAFAVLKGDGEGIVAGVERWLCNNQSPMLVSWNVAMTGN
ncbi:hypothetical protein ACIKP9_00155 [Methylobacillus methanolivorans]|uniref:GIY-YIG domain-containing protein n=1 Tax=Methylobacillus methanolivorans TaxID=1848927 RepID=A0ABW8GGZ1_9PROT